MAEPRISGIEVHTYTYTLDDLGKDYNGFNLVHVPGSTVTQTGHIIRILTDVGVVGEYAGGSAADYAILPSFVHYLIGAPRAASTFLRYALSSVAGGSAFDRWPAAWHAAMVQNAHAVLAELDAGTGEHLRESMLAQITCPITCIRGAESPPFLIRATERLRQIFPYASYQVVANAGHGLHIDQPAAFLQAVEHTVKQHLSRTNVPTQKESPA